MQQTITIENEFDEISKINKRLLLDDTVLISLFSVCSPLPVLNADPIFGVIFNRPKLKNDDISLLFGVLFGCLNLSKSDLLGNI